MRLSLVVAIAACTACTNHNVSSNEQAKEAFEGLNASIGKSITLGFQGFNAATSANIPPQMTTGDAGGTLTITGQVDQGSSANKTMRLQATMAADSRAAGYTDGPYTVDGNTLHVTYLTPTGSPPALNMMLMNIPTGTISGTLTGTFDMMGDLAGSVVLNLSFNGNLMAGPNNTVVRVAGSTTVTGTAMSNNGTFQVMVTL